MQDISYESSRKMIKRPPVNIDILREMKDDLKQVGALFLYGKTIRIYLESSPSYLQALRKAAHAHDIEEILRIAHTFKSSNSTFGAEVLAGMCGDLEKLARQNSTDHESVNLMIDRMEEEYDRVEQILSLELQEGH
jgi:HPt (histidine-containing phosphotransfer) domain-containing protein